MRSFSKRTIGSLLVVLSQLYSARAQRIVNYIPEVINNGLHYRSIFFSGDEQHGWVVGDEGCILRTENGGKQWDTVNSAPGDNVKKIGRLNKVFFANDLLGWAVGENGAILCSKDGGKHWLPAVQVPGHQNVNSIFFTANLKFGIAACDNAFVWISQDTGKTWIANNNILRQQEHAMLDARISPDGKQLIVCGKYASLVFSDNGGISFKDARIDEISIKSHQEHIYGMQFSADGARGVASCESGHILATVDSGRTWKNTTLPQNPNKNIAGIWTDALQENGWAVTSNGLLYRKLKGDKSWNVLFEFPQNPAPFSSVWFDKAGSTGWICGASGLLLVTHDAGKSWMIKQVPDNQEEPILTATGTLSRLSLDVVGMDRTPDGKLFILVTKQGHVYKSTDTCQSWKLIREGVLYGGLKDTLTSVRYSPGDGLFYIGGNHSRIFYADSVKTGLLYQGTPADKIINQLTAIPGKMMAVGTHGLVLTGSKDHWDKRIVNPGIDLYDVYLSGDGHTWVSGSESKLYEWKKVDNSFRIDSPAVDATNQTLVAVRFAPDKKFGFILSRSYSRESHLYQTTDWGTTWQPNRDFPVNDGLTSIRFGANDKEIWVSSVNGDIYRSVDRGTSWMPVQPRQIYGPLNVIETDPHNNLIIAGDGGTLIRARSTEIPVDTNIVAFRVDKQQLGDSLSIHLNKQDLPYPIDDPQLMVRVTYKDSSNIPGFPPVFLTTTETSTQRARWSKALFPQNRDLEFHMTAGNGWQMFTKKVEIRIGASFWSKWKEFLRWNKPLDHYDDVLKVLSINAGVLLGFYLVLTMILLLLLPRTFISWNEKASPLSFLLPGIWINLFSLLITRENIQRAFVRKFHAEKWNQFQKDRDTRKILEWVTQPVIIDKQVVKPENLLEQIWTKAGPVLVEKDRCHIHISGPAGTGKTSLACSLALTFFGFRPEYRTFYDLFRHKKSEVNPVLPIYINSLDQALDTMIADKIKNTYGHPNVSAVISASLMRNKRILVIIDGLSEMESFKPEFLDPGKGGKDNYLLITTSRIPFGSSAQVQILTQGQSTPVQSLERYSMTGSAQVPDNNAPLLKLLELLQPQKQTPTLLQPQQTFIPGSLIFYGIDILHQAGPASIGETQLLPFFIRIWESYLQSTFDKHPKKAQIIKQLRVLAYYCQGLHKFHINAGGPPQPGRHNLNEHLEETLSVSPQKISLDAINGIIQELQLDALIYSGIIRQSGPIDDYQLSFVIPSLNEFLAAKELLIRRRDNLIENGTYQFIWITSKQSNSFFCELVIELNKTDIGHL